LVPWAGPGKILPGGEWLPHFLLAQGWTFVTGPFRIGDCFRGPWFEGYPVKGLEPFPNWKRGVDLLGETS